MGNIFCKIRIFKRVKELEEYQKTTNRAFGILVSEINKIKKNQCNLEKSTPNAPKCETPEEFMRWFISNP